MREKKNVTNELKPVKKYREPMYPGKETSNELCWGLPDDTWGKWMKTKLSTAGLLVLTLNATPVLGLETAANNTGVVDQTQKKQKNENLNEQKIIIAPLFIHGNGSGATGCVVTSPPAFLSEADAIELIRTELKNQQLIFDKQDFIIDDVYSVDQRIIKNTKPGGKPWINESDKHPFYFDFYSTKYNLGIKFISRDNCFSFGKLGSRTQDLKNKNSLPDKFSGSFSFSSVIDYDMIESAQKIREYFKSNNYVNVVIFYDPMASIYSHDSYFNEKSIATMMESSRHLLKEQVEDFAVWFKKSFTGTEKW